MTPSDDNDDEVLDDLESETEQGWAETDPRSFVLPSNDEDDGAMGEGAREAAAPAGDTPGASCDVPTGAPGSVDLSVPSVEGIPVVERVPACGCGRGCSRGRWTLLHPCTLRLLLTT
mmetsp:Transcript_21224/g.54706  ORF Transcript_21224/g.54706 Transcript_21224/m.54706 type:complete len:117 (-) Transcript_21224:173-523(-)